MTKEAEQKRDGEKVAEYASCSVSEFWVAVGLPHKCPDLFRVVKPKDDAVEYLELVSWNPAWAVTELEKKKRSYRWLTAGSKEFDKRAIAVMHELLSFTLEKRLVTDYLTHFRKELVMPQKLMRIFLKHFGIFYVSERDKRLSVYLTEAYDGPELIEKCPLVLWKEKVQRLIGYRGRKQDIETYNEFSDMEGGDNLLKVDDKDDSEMELEDVLTAYKDTEKS
ncbi:hypothetical protein IFM89_039906 [Coptis chinensis]|uniref:PORR domain-containing protein n=1 Tax=Coptis chinensis TaxID=261450 RepID=A0A835GUB6_9MAGN|nr:hypothetical protein IFM89_039906 [Coptis chinensis]